MARTLIGGPAPKTMDAATTPANAARPTGYQVEDLQVDIERRRVLRADAELLADGLSFELFLALVRAAPEVVSVDELMRQVWPGLIVGPEAVTQRVKILRRALGDDAGRPRYLAGIRGRGYRLVAPAVAIKASKPSAIVPTFATPATADDTACGAAARAAEHNPKSMSGRWYLAAALGLVVLAVVILGHRLHPDASGNQARASGEKRNPSLIEPRTAVAVLPFVNLTGDPAKDYLGDGMAEQVINMLARVPGLKVPARTSSFAYKGRNVDVRRIAADLGVGTILEGSVREAGTRIRITAELINAQDGLHLWSQSYDRSFQDLFQLQDDLASAIVHALEVNIGAASTAAIAQIPRAGSVEAYDLYLQGEAVMAHPTRQSFQHSVEYFQAAVTRDPTLAAAYARMGNALAVAGEIGVNPIEQVAAAERAANQAFRLDPTIAESQEVLSNVASLRGHWLEAAAYSHRAVSLSPADASVHLVQGYLLDEVGQLRASLGEYDRAYALAPANLAVIMLRSFAQSLSGREADALESARLAEDMGLPHVNFATLYEQTALRSGRYADAAAAAVDILVETAPGELHAQEVVKLVYAALADPSRRAAAIAARTLLYPQPGSGAGHASIANATACLQGSYAYALLGEVGVAYDLANRCLDSMAPGAINSANRRLWTAGMRPFRQDRRFQSYAARLGLVQYWRHYGPPDECVWEAEQLKCH
jgi:TolB-like protein/DNA-binding winged helix-turn-helix (wHTH) protein